MRQSPALDRWRKKARSGRAGVVGKKKPPVGGLMASLASGLG